MAPSMDLQNLIDAKELQNFLNLSNFGILFIIFVNGLILYFGLCRIIALLRRHQPTSENDDDILSETTLFIDVKIFVDDQLDAEKHYATHLTTKRRKNTAFYI